MKKFLVIVSLIFLPLITFSAPPVEIVNKPVVQVEGQYTPPTQFETYSVNISSAAYILILPNDNNRDYFYVLNPSDSYILIISSSPNVPKNKGFYLYPRQVFASDGQYGLYGVMEDNAPTTLIRVGVER
jgi:hypothetical protein